MDPNTGCGSCPPGTEPWQVRRLKSGLPSAFHRRTSCSGRDCTFRGVAFKQSDCTSATCHSSYYVCANRSRRQMRAGQVICSPGKLCPFWENGSLTCCIRQASRMTTQGRLLGEEPVPPKEAATEPIPGRASSARRPGRASTTPKATPRIYVTTAGGTSTARSQLLRPFSLGRGFILTCTYG